MINLHLGIPRVVPNLLHSVAESGILKKSEKLYIMSKKDFQDNLRSLVNTKNRFGGLDYKAWRAAAEYSARFADYDAVAISQHAMLGHHEDCFMRGKVLPHAEARISRISEIVGDHPLTFHLAITSQFEYLSMAMTDADKGASVAMSASAPSWAGLVRRLKKTEPGRQIVIWDFEQPQTIALAFVMWMLDVHDGALVADLRILIQQSTDVVSTVTESHVLPGLEERIYQLDAQYEADLYEIEQIEGVSLIRSDAVHPELHL